MTSTKPTNKSVKKHLVALLLWYCIFIIIIPLVLRTEYNLMVYIPILDLIANVFSSSGRPGNRLFQYVYKLSPDSLISFLSTNFINLIALTGVAMVGTKYVLKTGNRWGGITIMLIMFSITYLLPTQGLHWIVDTIEKKIDDFRFNPKSPLYLNSLKEHMKYYHLWYDYLGGFIVVILLVVVESLFISEYLKLLDI